MANCIRDFCWIVKVTAPGAAQELVMVWNKKRQMKAY